MESQVGVGTTFTLFLPKVERPCPEAANDRAAPVREEARSLCILVVEDNKQVGDFAVQLLDELGHKSRLAADAREALRVLEKEASLFDMVFSDVVMPGMSGIELGREIRKRWPAMRVVLTSGYSHVLAQEGRHGFELLQKPYSVEGITAVLRRG